VVVEINPDDVEITGRLDDEGLVKNIIDWARSYFPSGDNVEYHVDTFQLGSKEIRLAFCSIGSSVDDSGMRRLADVFRGKGYVGEWNLLAPGLGGIIHLRMSA